MSINASLCSTCLSNLEEGAKLTDPLANFLCDVLHFKPQLLHGSKNTICRKCYKTLIELKCFYNQLRDVEVYFESKSDIIITSNENDIEEDVAEEDASYIGDTECTVSIADESKLDPILIDEDEECCIVENDIALKKQKTSNSTTSKRFVCLKCSKLFRSFDDLRSHEKTHSLQPIQKASPVFLQATSQVSQNVSCQECGKHFFNKVSLEAHMRNHQTIKSIHLYCTVCKHKFPNKELLLNHQGEHECKDCPEKYCSLTNLQKHMKEEHNGRRNDSDDILEIVDPNRSAIQQVKNNDEHLMSLQKSTLRRNDSDDILEIVDPNRSAIQQVKNNDEHLMSLQKSTL